MASENSIESDGNGRSYMEVSGSHKGKGVVAIADDFVPHDLDMDVGNKCEGKSNELFRSISSDSSSCHDENSEEDSMVVDCSVTPTFCLWKREVLNAKAAGTCVLEIPQDVVKTGCLSGVNFLDIVDARSGDSYECEVHSFDGGNYIGKFLGRGWVKFAKHIGLSNGDIVGFSIKYPPSKEIVVTLLSR